MSNTSNKSKPTRSVRLNLDFSLVTSQERSDFIVNYLALPMFERYPPTPDELSTISDYILWGVDSVTGKNGRQSKQYGLRGKHSTWDTSCPEESLEELVASPAFNEASLHEITCVGAAKKTKEKIDRAYELERAGDLYDTLLSLFREIDELDWQIEHYELTHNRRTKPIRPELEQSISEARRTELAAATLSWSQYRYLKKKHELVEKRQEQYTIRDGYAPISGTNTEGFVRIDEWGGQDQAELMIWPAGRPSDWGGLLYKGDSITFPALYRKEELANAVKWYWALGKQDIHGARCIDFRNGYHVQQIAEHINELRAESRANGANHDLLEVYEFYKKRARLNDIHQRILQYKEDGQHNQWIAAAINQEFDKTYTTNYISTIYCQKILAAITHAARDHQEQLESLALDEEWKVCTRCGRTLLRNNNNFTKRNRSNDGLSARCKQCEKEVREERKRS